MGKGGGALLESSGNQVLRFYMSSFLLGFLDTVIVNVIFVLLIAKLSNSAFLHQFRPLLLVLFVAVPFIVVFIHLYLKSIKNRWAYLGVVVGIPVAVALSLFIATIISGGK